jgi:hypothetical protein
MLMIREGRDLVLQTSMMDYGAANFVISFFSIALLFVAVFIVRDFQE